MKSKPNINNLKKKFLNFRSEDKDPIQSIFWESNSEIILKLANDNTHKGHTILDIGCGEGNTLIELSDMGRECHGIDPLLHPFLINARDRAKYNNIEINLACAQGEKLPFRDNLFDGVLCLSSLQHVNDQNQTLYEIKRVLKKNGVLIISVPQTIRKSTFNKSSFYTMHFNLKLLKQMLQKYDFNIVDTKACGFVHPIISKILSPVYPYVGERLTKKILTYVDSFAKIMPQYGSSIIIVAEGKK